MFSVRHNALSRKVSCAVATFYLFTTWLVELILAAGISLTPSIVVVLDVGMELTLFSQLV